MDLIRWVREVLASVGRVRRCCCWLWVVGLVSGRLAGLRE